MRQLLQDTATQLRELRQARASDRPQPAASAPQVHAPQPPVPVNKMGNPAKKWNFRFDGTNQGMSIDTFLYKVDKLLDGDRVPEEEFLQNFHRLLSGRADTWYWAHVRTAPRQSWLHLRSALRERFRRQDTDHEIMADIIYRKQGPKETLDDYVDVIRDMQQQMQDPIEDAALVETMRRNIDPRIAQAVFSSTITTLDQFRSICRKAERQNTPRGAHPITYYSATSKSSYDPKPRRNVNEFEAQSPVCEIDTDPVNELMTPEDDERAVEAFQPSQKPFNRNSRDTTNWLCWNCDQKGHGYFDCRSSERRTFCYTCGAKGIYKPDCRKCNSENRKAGPTTTGNYRSPPALPESRTQN